MEDRDRLRSAYYLLNELNQGMRASDFRRAKNEIKSNIAVATQEHTLIKNQRLVKSIKYAIDQEDQTYGMDEDEAIKFRMRKVFSILKESLE
jgi:hypothetical protein